MENNLPSILGGMAQGFTDFGKGLFDMFGTGGASVLDLIESAKTGNVTNRRQDDFRKWLYQTDSTKDAAAKGLGAALNGVQTVADYIPGVNALTQTTLGNAAQGALGGLADELKTYGEDYDLGRAGQRAAISAAGAVASGGLADALKGSNNALLSSNTVRGLARGATGGAISGGGYAAIDGGDVLEAAKQGAGMGALIGGATGAFQDFKPSKTYNVALTDDERAARIANAQKQIDDIGAVSRFSNNPDDIAKRARITELQNAIKAYQSGYDTVQDYTDAMAAKRANRANTQSATTTQGQVYAPSMGEMEYGAPIQDGYTRLYRGMTQEFDPQYNRNAMDNMNGYESWTDNYDLANRYGDGKYVYSIDVPTSRIANSLYDENPNSATYGDRNFISAIDKAAGLDDVDGNEYLLNTNDELRSGLTYNRVNAPRALETTLADADMAVNSAKIAPGQLGLFDDMPTQTPKTGTRQTSLFDQPQEGLDYYGSDIEIPIPENGLVSRDIEDLTQVPIDANTLPKGWLKARELADMGKRAKQIVLDPNDPNRAQNEYNVALYSDAQYGRNMPVADVIDRLGQIQYGREVDRGAARLLADQLNESGDEFARKFVTGAAEAGGNISHYRDAPKAKLADEQLSNLLNIGRSSSMLSDSLANPSARNARGDQWKGTINLDGKSIAKGSDGGISTFGHERLHAFQDAGNMGYDKRVVDAYNELHDDLSKIYHSDSQIRKDYGGDVKYWGKPIEQEARMAQFYLEDKFGVKGAHKVPERDANGKAIRYKDDGTIADPNNLRDYYTGKPAYRGEFEGDRKAINAAFDKFRGKLQDLTRKGVALPAFLTLLGGGAYMASQENDKEKEVK